MNVICACIHRDETTPHLHVYVVPLDSRGKLNCRSFLGGASTLREMQTAFAKRVAASHGLERGVEGSRAHHQSVRRFYGCLEAMADDPRLKPMQMRRYEQVPPEPRLMDKLNGSAEPMKKARALALDKRARDEEYNHQAAAHNRRRAELLEQLAGRGLAHQVAQQERCALAKSAADQAMRATASERVLDLVSATARKRAEEIKKLKAERDDQGYLVQKLIDELTAASPGRARELGLIEREPQLKPKREQPSCELDTSQHPSNHP
ncbi:hypothetical protein BH759_05715 [Ralstonia solanacearum]|nr:hypothetical protein BH759_05715 [Ralstonia solanacearum]